MVYLNGKFIDIKDAKISVLDRGFLFADSVYEVIPVYNKCIFRTKQHLDRLGRSLDALNIQNPYNTTKWQEILLELISRQKLKIDDLLIYIQITRGVAANRSHINKDILIPTVFINVQKLVVRNIKSLTNTYKAATAVDIRWARCDIKSTSLLANILLLQQAKTQQNDIEEVILLRDNIITEGASSNVFIVKNNEVFTHPENNDILSGITRGVVIEAISQANIKLTQKAVDKKFLLAADEVWISSSTREIMPITYIDNKAINNGNIGKLWHKVYSAFQMIKS